MNTDMNSTNRNRRRPFVKVCGQTYTGSVDCAVAYGASYIGFNFCLGSPRYVSPSHAAGMRSVNVKRVGVFQQQRPAEICRIMRQAGLHLAQLQGGHTPQDRCGARGNPPLGTLLPGIPGRGRERRSAG